MDTSLFWGIIQESLQFEASSEEQLEWLEEKLEDLPQDDVIEFQKALFHVRRLTFRWDLWHAAYVAMEGCSDDSFEDFTGWLIANGQQVFESVIENPDNLADFLPEDPESMWCEDIHYVTYDILGDDILTDLANDAPEVGPEPAGEQFDFDDEAEAKRRLPRLVARLRGRD